MMLHRYAHPPLAEYRYLETLICRLASSVASSPLVAFDPQQQ